MTLFGKFITNCGQSHEIDAIASEHIQAEAAGEERDVGAIELTADHFKQALEAVSLKTASEFGADASRFEDVLEGTEGES